MKITLSMITLITVLLCCAYAIAADKVVVIPLGGKGSISPNQHCPGKSPVIGIDADGQIICGTKTVFVSSKYYGGNLGGLKGADAECNTLAANAGLSGYYKAWLSNTTSEPLSSFIRSMMPYVLTDGTVIANNWFDLTDMQLLAPISLDEYGNTRSIKVWTNTNWLGEAQSSTGTLCCSGFITSNATQTAMTGLSGETGSGWTGKIANTSCSSTDVGIYCFEQ